MPSLLQRSGLAAVLAAAALLVSAAPAPAARVEVTSRVESCPRAMCLTVMFQIAAFTAGKGETNVVTVRAEPGAVLFADTVSVIEAGRGCERVDDHLVRCTFPTRPPGLGGSDSTSVNAGDGDDAVHAEGHEGLINIDGGAGADVLVGGPGRDTLRGGDGPDTVSGGDGDDRLAEGEAAPAADVVDGGPGLDTLDYGDRRAGVSVDLAAGSGDGGDRIAAIEAVTGGAGADTIRGDAGDNALTGGAGNDRLAGADGADRLLGTTGRDALDGGAGDDTLDGDSAPFGEGSRDTFSGGDGDDQLFTGDGHGERVHCGAGVDSVAGQEAFGRSPDRRDVLMGDCERAGAGYLAVPQDAKLPWVPAQPRRLTPRLIAFANPCRSCRGWVSVSVGGRKLGTAGFKRRRTIRVRLRPKLPARRPVMVQFRWRVRLTYYLEDIRFTVPLGGPSAP